MKTEHVVKALEELARQFGREVRWEKGHFRGGHCLVNGEELIMLNKHHPPEVHLTILAESLHDLPIDSIFLRPAVREAFEAAWQRHPESLRETLLKHDEADAK